MEQSSLDVQSREGVMNATVLVRRWGNETVNFCSPSRLKGVFPRSSQQSTRPPARIQPQGTSIQPAVYALGGRVGGLRRARQKPRKRSRSASSNWSRLVPGLRPKASCTNRSNVAARCSFSSGGQVNFSCNAGAAPVQGS